MNDVVLAMESAIYFAELKLHKPERPTTGSGSNNDGGGGVELVCLVFANVAKTKAKH